LNGNTHTNPTKRLLNQRKDLLKLVKEIEEERNQIEEKLKKLKSSLGLDPHTDYASWIDNEGNLINLGDCGED